MVIIFKNFRGTCAPLHLNNVDTDQILPARYLTATDKNGFGDLLFRDLRFKEDGVTVQPDFSLNDAKFKNAEILLVGENFGGGSSREHAPWAILGFGFKAVVGISFADIFKNNALKNGLIIIELPPHVVGEMFVDVGKDPRTMGSVDLEREVFNWNGVDHQFYINPFVKKCLTEGLDDIGYTQSFLRDIEHYESVTMKKI